MGSCVTLRLSLGTLAAAFVALSTAGCTSLLGDFSSGESTDASTMDGTTTTGDGSMPNGDGNAPGLGLKCTKTADCTTGQTCADGVCCESACDGVCESCNQAGALGHCNPIPAMTDPAMECVAIPLPEAGAPEAGTSSDAGADGAASTGDAGDDAGDAAAVVVADAASDAAPGDGGALDADTTFNLPDAGVTTMAGVCAGSCNGARACAYPDTKTSCGTQFCNSSTELGGFSCDGTGRCAPSIADCKNYTCQAADAGAQLGMCATGCSKESDCSDLAFCDGTSCQPKHGNGIACTAPNQCETGFCVTNGPSSVCCNSACDPSIVTGGTCSASGSVGECTCPQCSGAGNSCVLWYRDFDGDTYGDKFGTIAASTAQVGCSMSSPPAGWVANNGDCDDHDGNVNPGQAGFFTHPSAGTSTYDYNCDGVLSKQTPEFIGASCGTCEDNPSCGDFNCGSSTGGTSLGCHNAIFCGIIRTFDEVKPLTSGITTQAQPIGTIVAPPISTIVSPPVGTIVSPPIGIQEYCCSSGNSGFTSFSSPTTSPTGSCGITGTKTTCGNCNGSGAAAYSTASAVQGCH
jgi:hypothetical protein